MDGNPLEIVAAPTRRSTAQPEAPLYELALAFCRECLGWADAFRSGEYILENKHRPELNHATGRIHGYQIAYRDFGNVMNAVREWCDIYAVALFLEYSPGSDKDAAWRVRLAPHAEAEGSDLCGVMMQACLEAHRHIGEGGARAGALEAKPSTRNPASSIDMPWGDVRKNAPIALAFCKECMGWGRAELYNDFGYVCIREWLAAYPVKPGERWFHCNEAHLDTVMEAVKAWSDARAISFSLDYFPSGSASDCWRACIGTHAEADSNLATTALMTACLATHRKILGGGIMSGLLDRSKK